MSRILKVKTTNTKAQELLDTIAQFSTLKENWDSYGAAPVSVEAMKQASDFVELCDTHGLPLFYVCPGPNGEVMVELKNENKIAAEVEFFPDDKPTMAIFDADNNAIHYGEVNIVLLRQYLQVA